MVSTATTTVLSILSLTTVPTLVRRRVSCANSSIITLRSAARASGLPATDLRLAGQHPRDVLANLAQPVAVGKLPGRLLEAQVEQLLPQLGQLALEPLLVEVAQLGRLHSACTSSFCINFVCIGSLCD